MSDAFNSNPPAVLRPSLGLEYDGRGREIRFSLEEPNEDAVIHVLETFVKLCEVAGP